MPGEKSSTHFKIEGKMFTNHLSVYRTPYRNPHDGLELSSQSVHGLSSTVVSGFEQQPTTANRPRVDFVFAHFSVAQRGPNRPHVKRY